MKISFIVEESLLTKSGHVILDVNDFSASQIPFSFNISVGEYLKIDTDGFYANRVNSGDPHFDTYFERGARIKYDIDADGQVIGNWDVNIYKNEFGQPGGFLGGLSIISTSNGLSSIDSVESLYPFTGTGTTNDNSSFNANVVNNPGAWSRSPVPVPLPGEFLLFGSVCLAMFTSLRKKIVR